jgi:cyclin-dependent kinase
MAFVQYLPRAWTDVLPYASQDAMELVQRLITYESGDRMKADEVSPSFMINNLC